MSKRSRKLTIPPQVAEIIDQLHAEYIRTGKHTILWRLPNGQVVGFSKTTSDNRAIKNFRSEVRRKSACGS